VLGFRLRHFVADGDRASYRQTRAASIGEKIQRRLCTHFWLPHHVRKNFRRRLCALLPAKAEDGDYRDHAQDKNNKESAEHIQSSCTMVICCPPVCSRSSCTPF